MGKEYYEILGLEKDASEEQIKKGYKKKALQYHPDKNKATEAEEKFKEIAEAYEVLNDKDKKLIFDKYGVEGLDQKAGTSQNNFSRNSRFHPTDPFDLFKTFFGGNDPFADIFSSVLHQHMHQVNLNFSHAKHAPVSTENGTDDPAAATTYDEKAVAGGAVTITKTIVGGDGRVRREMRFRTQSAGRAEEDTRRKTDGKTILDRQHSAPTGYVSTSTPITLHRTAVMKESNSRVKAKEVSSASITIQTPIPNKACQIKINHAKSAEPKTTKACTSSDNGGKLTETKITIHLKT